MRVRADTRPWDHIGDNHAVSQATGADIAVHPADRAMLEFACPDLSAERRLGGDMRRLIPLLAIGTIVAACASTTTDAARHARGRPRGRRRAAVRPGV